MKLSGRKSDLEKLLDSISLPQGLRNLSPSELSQVCAEVRDELISSVLSSGGHFASSLGVTELTVALHHCFDAPHDKLVWDVGHQGYIHKILTGRRARMSSIRNFGGISGFLRRDESEYDCFGAGHAGTSISAAVGMKVALDRQGKQNYVVTIIGDGAMTAGMAFEALNHAGDLKLKNFIVVLNDNEMSISPNVGALSWLFSRAVTSKASNRARTGFKNLYKKGYLPEIIYNTIDRAEEATQGLFASAAMLFESFGFRYIGPVDGHKMDDLLLAINNARQQDVPVLIHAHTKKGKGHDQAEVDPVKWHAVSPSSGKEAQAQTVQKTAPSGQNEAPPLAIKVEPSITKKNLAITAPTYTDVFAMTLKRIAEADEKVVAITAAMAGGTGLDQFAAHFPQRYFDVGICEQHAVTFAAGMACEGLHPFCAIYSTFLQRAYDQVLHDVCIQKLPVVFAMDRSGVVGNDGETHQGVFDIAYLRTIPEIVLMSPANENEFQHMLFTASRYQAGPVAIRYPRGKGLGVSMDEEFMQLPIGKAELVSRGSEVLIITYGPMLSHGLEVSSMLKTELGISPTLINARFVKPLDKEMFATEIPRHKIICSIEDHALQGGFGSALIEYVNDQGLSSCPIMRFGVQDLFVPHASQSEQYRLNCYDPLSIFEKIKAVAVGLGKSDLRKQTVSFPG